MVQWLTTGPKAAHRAKHTLSGCAWEEQGQHHAACGVQCCENARLNDSLPFEMRHEHIPQASDLDIDVPMAIKWGTHLGCAKLRKLRSRQVNNSNLSCAQATRGR